MSDRVERDAAVESTVEKMLERTQDQVEKIFLVSLIPAGSDIMDFFDADSDAVGKAVSRTGERINRLVRGSAFDLQTLRTPWEKAKGQLRVLISKYGVGQDAVEWIKNKGLQASLKRLLQTEEVVSEGSQQIARLLARRGSLYGKAQRRVTDLEVEHRRFVGGVKWVVRGVAFGLAASGGVAFPVYVAAGSLALLYTLLVTGDMFDSDDYLPRFWDGPAARVRDLMD